MYNAPTTKQKSQGYPPRGSVVEAAGPEHARVPRAHAAHSRGKGSGGNVDAGVAPPTSKQQCGSGILYGSEGRFRNSAVAHCMPSPLPLRAARGRGGVHRWGRRQPVVDTVDAWVPGLSRTLQHAARRQRGASRLLSAHAEARAAARRSPGPPVGGGGENVRERLAAPRAHSFFRANPGASSLHVMVEERGELRGRGPTC